jgi:4-alpha-glucanotransferase
VAQFAAEQAERVAYHEWIQWLLARQLDEANQALPLVQDLPIGFDPGGADAWAWQDLLAFGASVGAPPDLFNTRGQDWGLPPFIPHRLKAAGFAPFRETIRALLKHAGGRPEGPRCDGAGRGPGARPPAQVA